jgi:LysM repeat protein
MDRMAGRLRPVTNFPTNQQPNSKESIMSVVNALQGYDASNFKPDLDPMAVPHDFAFWQTTWGAGAITVNGIVNGVWTGADAKIQAEIRRGTPWGFMHYIRGEQSPEAEARFFVDNNQGYFHHGVPAVDWEEADNAAYGDITWLDRWLAETIRLTGVPPIVYYSGADADRVLPVCAKHDCAPWPAAYGSMEPTGYQASPWGEDRYGGTIRQYASTGRLPGYDGDLDLDKFYGSMEQLWAYARLDDPAHTPAPAPEPSPAPTTAVATYIVQPGDTLSAIAARYNVPISAITGYASGDPDLIRVGETLTINSAGGATYTVQPGDTLSGIAARYNVPMSAITGYSSGDPDLIRVGETLTINR